WTDYNAHDPGITLLESLLHAGNDLAYRAGWEIRDLLAGASDQAFFTARDALTVNPVTPDDYRRPLIHPQPGRNAWVACRDCACDDGVPAVHGLYDVRIELEPDFEVGDPNDRMVTTTLRLDTGSETLEIIVEARFPRIELADRDELERFLALPAAVA